MNSNIQSILIRRKSKIYIDLSTPASDTYNKEMIAAIIGNFGSLGYVLDKSILSVLKFCSESELIEFYNEIYPILKNEVGFYHFNPMYPNFPKQVANASDAELYINAIMHYFGDAIGERIVPEYTKEIRFPFCEYTDPRFLGLADQTDFDNMWSELFESKSSPSIQDKEDIRFFFGNYKPIAMSPDFSNKEKMSFVLGYLLTKDMINEFNNWSRRNVKTATDVLRIAVAYSNGDESLTKPSKFGKFPRSIRKTILSLLNEMNQNSVQEDMMRFKGMWLRLGEKLHPTEYQKLYPNISYSFDKLRNSKIITTNSKIESYLKSNDFKNLMNILTTRPGDFARRLNAILTKADDPIVVIESFETIVDKVSSPVLWSLYGYFNGRNELTNFSNRLFLPKTPKALVSKNNLSKIDFNVQCSILRVIRNAIYNKYKSNLFLNKKVWIDPICKNLLIPNGNRSTSNALRQVARGSRFKINDNKSTIRLFVYWKDVGINRVDLDLSAVMYDKDWKFIGQCSWTNLRNGEGKNATMIHSGDITSAPNGASEFLDINIDKLNPNVAYIACDVYNYTGQKMNQLDVGFMGWMEREYPNSGEIFEPKSVMNRCDLTSNSTSTCPLVLDIKSKEIIWCDMSLTLNAYSQSTETTMDKSIATAQLITRKNKTTSTLEDLFKINVMAKQGMLVYNREDADYIISEDGNLSPYDINKIMSDWM